MCTTTPAIDTWPLYFAHLFIHTFRCIREKLGLGTRLETYALFLCCVRGLYQLCNTC